MIFNHRYFNFCSFILITIFLSTSTATFCSNLTSTDDKDTPCFLQPPTRNPARLRSSGNSLILPCHVARSKRSTVEWWYQDFKKLVNIKVYPVFPAVRPTVLRFITSSLVTSKTSNETDIMDVSILLRHVNVDDSGIYRCIARPWSPAPLINIDDILNENPKIPVLSYHVELSGPRLCQASLSPLPCFQNTRTSSPTIIDAYQTAFLQCVIQNYNRPVNVFWVVGNETGNNVLITDYLSTNQYRGDRLRRVFPLSPFDYSIELTIHRDTPERSYSCVIDGNAGIETTLFTYIVRSIDLEDISSKPIKTSKNETITPTIHEKEQEKEKEKEKEKEAEIEIEISPKKAEKIVSHDALTPEQIDELRQKSSHEHSTSKTSKEPEVEEESLEILGRKEAEPTKKED